MKSNFTPEQADVIINDLNNFKPDEIEKIKNKVRCKYCDEKSNLCTRCDLIKNHILARKMKVQLNLF